MGVFEVCKTYAGKFISENSSSYKMGKSNKHKQYVKRAKLKGGAKRKRSVKQEVPAMPPLPGLIAPSQVVGPPAKRSRTSSGTKPSWDSIMKGLPKLKVVKRKRSKKPVKKLKKIKLEE